MSHFAEFIIDMMFSLLEDVYVGRKKMRFKSKFMRCIEWLVFLIRDILVVSLIALIAGLVILLVGHLFK